MNRSLVRGQQELVPPRRNFGDEYLPYQPARQRRRYQVGAFGEKTSRPAPAYVTMQFDRRGHPGRAFGEHRRRPASGRNPDQAASPEGALTSSGSAARATSTSAVNAAGSLIAMSARFFRSTSTPAAFSPWISRL